VLARALLVVVPGIARNPPESPPPLKLPTSTPPAAVLTAALNIDAVEAITIAVSPTVNLRNTVLTPYGKHPSLHNRKPDNSRLSCGSKARLNAFGTLALTHRCCCLLPRPLIVNNSCPRSVRETPPSGWEAAPWNVAGG
jgi:hypothetical protein